MQESENSPGNALKISIETMNKIPEKIHHFKTKKMCKNAVKSCRS